MSATVIDLGPRIAARQALEGRSWNEGAVAAAREMREILALFPPGYDHPAFDRARAALERAAEAGIIT